MYVKDDLPVVTRRHQRAQPSAGGV